MGRFPWTAADPLVGSFFENSTVPTEPLCYDVFPPTASSRRCNRTAHLFLAWRLHDSMPPHRVFPKDSLNSGQAFAVMDRLLDETRRGTFYRRQPAIAEMIVEALRYNAERSASLNGSGTTFSRILCEQDLYARPVSFSWSSECRMGVMCGRFPGTPADALVGLPAATADPP